MWTIVLLDHNGHREEQELPALVPLVRKPTRVPPEELMKQMREDPKDLQKWVIFRTKEYKLSCHDTVNRKAIYLEVL